MIRTQPDDNIKNKIIYEIQLNKDRNKNDELL